MGERRVKRKHPFKFQTWYGHTNVWYKKCQLCTAMSRSKNGKTPKLCSSHGHRWTLYSKLKKDCTEICHVFFQCFTLCPLSFNFVFIIQFKTISHGIRQKKMEMKRKKKKRSCVWPILPVYERPSRCLYRMNNRRRTDGGLGREEQTTQLKKRFQMQS